MRLLTPNCPDIGEARNVNLHSTPINLQQKQCIIANVFNKTFAYVAVETVAEQWSPIYNV